jgi:hypothetical protein
MVAKTRSDLGPPSSIDRDGNRRDFVVLDCTGDFMNTRKFQSLVIGLAAAGAVVLLAGSAAAQDASTSTATTPAPAATAVPQISTSQPATTQPAPQLAYGVGEVLQLAHANVSDDIIVNYVQNSGNAYGLNADQIVYLRQQGVSDRVINAMLTQRAKLAATVPVPTPAPEVTDTGGSTAPPPQPAPDVQSAPSSTVYVVPDTQTAVYYANYYPYYYGYPYYYPGVVVGFGWGYRGGYWGGWHGGYSGGFHGGGGFGGGFHGGGGFHR